MLKLTEAVGIQMHQILSTTEIGKIKNPIHLPQASLRKPEADSFTICAKLGQVVSDALRGFPNSLFPIIIVPHVKVNSNILPVIGRQYYTFNR